MAKRGRPPSIEYSEELSDAVYQSMADGHDVVDTCDTLGIPRTTFYDWQAKYPDFRAKCARAREALADYDVKRIREEIAMTDKDTAVAARVKISALQWLAEKRAPKQHGNKTSTEVTGKDGGAIEIQSKVIDANALTFDQRESVRQALLAALETEDE